MTCRVPLFVAEAAAARLERGLTFTPRPGHVARREPPAKEPAEVERPPVAGGQFGPHGKERREVLLVFNPVIASVVYPDRLAPRTAREIDVTDGDVTRVSSGPLRATRGVLALSATT